MQEKNELEWEQSVALLSKILVSFKMNVSEKRPKVN